VRQIGSKLRTWIGALALCATFGVAVLPNGQLPKIAGPCGRALCNCAPEIVRDPVQRSCKRCAPRLLTLGSAFISAADAPGLAFQVLVDGAVLAEITQAVIEPVKIVQPPILARVFSAKICSYDVPTPPPRA
jgi:hypothetical protein